MKYEIWLNQWLIYYVKPYVKERTYQKYSRQVALHIIPKIGGYEMEQLSAVILQEFVVSLSEKGLAPNSVNGVITVIKSSLEYAVKIDLLAKHYGDCIRRPKACEKVIECFSKEEQRQIEGCVLGNKSSRFFGVVLCLYTGLRIGELLALKWTDIDLQKGFLKVEKSCHDTWTEIGYCKIIDTPKTESSKRIIPLPEKLIAHLKDLKKGASGEYVIEGKLIYGVSVRSYQKSFEQLLKRLNISHRGFHSLRHTFATRALECGMDVKTLAEILGHKNPTVTLKRYAHSMIEHKVEMMNRLGKFLQ